MLLTQNKYDYHQLSLLIIWKGHPINTWCYDIYYKENYHSEGLRVSFGNNYWGPTGFDQATKEGTEDMKKLFNNIPQ